MICDNKHDDLSHKNFNRYHLQSVSWFLDLILKTITMKTLLIATDFSEASRIASEYGVQLAKLLNAKIFLVNAFPHMIPVSDAAMVITDEELEENSKTRLNEERIWLTQKYDVDIQTASGQGQALEVILAVAKGIHADWLVAGMKGSSRIARLMFGGTSFVLSRHSHIPVILIPDSARFTLPRTIALASDLTDDTNIHILDALKDFGERCNATMYVVRVIKKGMNEMFERLLKPSLLKWHFKELHPTYEFLNDADVAHAMNSFAKEYLVDIVVMIKQEHNLFEKIFHKSNIKEMILNTKVPLIILSGEVDDASVVQRRQELIAD
jgi:nucleotide-binding universal stress UspA family protein